eukprot:Hpha_TRINITY_DN5430_c0_g1::TRINITY_DN5430_c0_g1_i1::g.192325::m.192325
MRGLRRWSGARGGRRWSSSQSKKENQGCGELTVTPQGLRDIIDDYDRGPGEERDEVLLYEPKPLYVVQKEVDRRGSVLMRDYFHSAMWGVPNELRVKKGFLQRGRLQDLRYMQDYMYDTEFADISGPDFVDEVQRWRNEPMLRPAMPSLLNPQFAEALLAYFFKQMKRLGTKRLIIYEAYGHNGQTALSLLDILQEKYPEVYATCEYHMIDVLGLWMTHRDTEIKAHHYDHFFEHHVSFFDWEVLVEDRVFFLCLECLSYLPLDRVEAHSFDGGTKWQFWETWVREKFHADERQVSTGLPMRYEEEPTHRMLQDGLILEYLQHIDYEGIFDRSKLEQHLRDTAAMGDMEDERVAFGNEVGLAGKSYAKMCNAGYTQRDWVRHSMGLLDNVFWIPTMMVSFFDKLRRYFPRHTLFVLDRSGIHTYITGRDAPSVKQYAFGTNFDQKYVVTHDGTFGRTEMRANLNFAHMRELYYKMMGLELDHPLHLRCMNLRNFFETYGTEEVMKGLSVRDMPQEYAWMQPLDVFPGARVLVSEFGADAIDVGDLPADAATRQGHARQRFYDRAWNFLVRVGVASEESLYRISQRQDPGGIKPDLRQRLPNLVHVRERIGPNPGPLQLDVPISYKDPDEDGPSPGAIPG